MIERDDCPPSASEPAALEILYPRTGKSALRGLYLCEDLRSLVPPAGAFVYTNFIASLDGRIALERPEEMRKVQRRKHYRVLRPDMVREVNLKSVPEGEALVELKRDSVIEQDISASGLALQTTVPVPAGAILGFVLDLDSGTVTCDAEVVRTNEVSPGTYKVGLQFADISAEDQDRIASYVLEKQLEKP